MWLFLLYYGFSLTLACVSIEPGKLYISKIENTSTHRNLKIYGGKLYVSDEVTIFNYVTSGIFAIPEIGFYLGVDEICRFAVQDRPHLGFSLQNMERPTRVLAYENSEIFQLCEDNLIAYQSNCRGAIPVKITFESISV